MCQRRSYTRRPWSPEDCAVLSDRYERTPTRELAELLGRPVSQVYRKAASMGIAKNAEFLKQHCRIQPGSQLGKATQFRKGQHPPNKGLRRPGWAPGQMAETQFKKGQRSGMAARNWKPVGTILTDSEGYLRIKVREAEYGKEASGFGNTKVWPLYQRVVWASHHGPIPPGRVIVFKDGNRQNCAPENLESISRGELAKRNRMWNRFPRELAETIQLVGALKRKIRRLQDAQKQD